MRFIYGLIFASLPVLAGPISGVSIYSVTSEFTQSGWDLRAIHLVDGSGLTGGAHGSCYDNATCWQTNVDGPGATIVFDLGGVYTLDSIQVWNGYWANFQSARGMNQFRLQTSADLSGWTDRGLFNAPMAPTVPDTYTGWILDTLSWAGTRYVEMEIISNHGGGDCAACTTLSEILFSEPDDIGEVPEPAAAVLLGWGFGALWILKRRR